jgi:ribonuclease BN (tRNA processing enzyme)
MNNEHDRFNLTFIGCGGAFTMKNWQSNMLFTHVERKWGIDADGNGSFDAGGNLQYSDVTRRMLLDCGGDARFALAEMGLGAKDIDDVYVSHCHADHIGGLEWLGFSRYFSPGRKPNLYINEKLADHLWTNSLKGGMASHQGVLLTLDSFFDKVDRIPRNGHFSWGDRKFRLVQTVHYMDGYEIVPSYGLLIETKPGKEVFITTDTQFCPNQIMDFYKRASVIFQDCETYDLSGKIKSGVHAHYTELKTLPEDIRRKMWLYHYNDGELPKAAEDDGFAGFVIKGQTFSF